MSEGIKSLSLYAQYINIYSASETMTIQLNETDRTTHSIVTTNPNSSVRVRHTEVTTITILNISLIIHVCLQGVGPFAISATIVMIYAIQCKVPF